MDDAPSHPGPSHPVMAPPSSGLSSATQSDSAVVRPPFWDSGPWAGRSRRPQRPSLRLGDVSTSTSNPTARPAATRSAEGLPCHLLTRHTWASFTPEEQPLWTLGGDTPERRSVFPGVVVPFSPSFRSDQGQGATRLAGRCKPAPPCP